MDIARKFLQLGGASEKELDHLYGLESFAIKKKMATKTVQTNTSIFYILQIATTQRLQHFTVNGRVITSGCTAVRSNAKSRLMEVI